MNSEIERLAKEAGVEVETFGNDEFWSFEPEALAKFAALVAEECANVAEAQDELTWYGYENPNTFDDGKRAAASAIRAKFARGNEKDAAK